jgi:hypothetical protein
MNSKEDEQISGSISSDQSHITLIIADEESSEERRGQLIRLLLLDEAEETVVEGMQSQEKMGLNPGHAVIDPKPEMQESTQNQGAEQMAPDLREAIEKFRRRLRALGYRLPDINPLIDTLKKIGKNPAKALRKIAKKLPPEVKESNIPRKAAQPENPLTPVHESENLWRQEDEELENLELYWANKFKDAKPHNMATETVSFVTRRK